MSPELMEIPIKQARNRQAVSAEERLADAFANSVSSFHFKKGPHSDRESEISALIKEMFEADDSEEVQASLAFAVGVWDEGFRVNTNISNFGLFNAKLSVDYPPLRIDDAPEAIIDEYLLRGYAIIDEAEGIDEFFRWFSNIQDHLENSVDN